jgi:hypothetical protein
LPEGELCATEARGAFFDAVRPLVASTLDAADAETRELLAGRVELRHLHTGETHRVRAHVLAQFHPLLVRVVAVGMPHAVELSRWGRRMLPDPDRVEAALESVLHGALSLLPSEDADAILLIEASTREGGLAVLGDPESGTLKMLSVLPGQDLSEALVFGAIEDAPEVAH